MLFKTLNGRTRDVPVIRYAIDWEPLREVSRPQGLVKAFLRPFWSHKMVCEEVAVPVRGGRKLRFDLWNISDQVVVEVSPKATHTQFNPFMHGSLAGFRGVLKRDLDKERWCEINGLTLVTLDDHDIANLSVELFAARGVVL